MKNIRFLSLLVLPLTLTGCVANAPSGGDTAADSNAPIEVTITDDTCEVSTSEVPSGRVNFRLTNKGTVRNEFEILAPDKLRICLLYTSPSPRDKRQSRMPSSA